MRYRNMSRRCGPVRGGCAGLALALASLLLAGPPAQGQPREDADAKAAAGARKAAPAPSMPDAEGIVLLIRTTLITLNDAVQTGNFTVLRDRGAPGFRDANSAARLGVVFASLARRGVDLAAVSILAPQLDQTPAIDPKSHLLRIKGHFPGKPVRIDFDLLFQPVAGRWRVFGLSVQPVSTAAAAAKAAKTKADGKSAAATAGE